MCFCPLPSQMKLAELQDLVMRLVSERNDWYSRYTSAVTGAAAANPDLLPVGQDHTGAEHQALSQTEPDAVGGAGTGMASTCDRKRRMRGFVMAAHSTFPAEAMEIVPLSEPGTGSEPPQPFLAGSAQPDTKPLGPKEDGTAQQIMQLLQEIQNPQGTARSPPFLGENPCIPFFYRPDEQDEVKILVVWGVTGWLCVYVCMCVGTYERSEVWEKRNSSVSCKNNIHKHWTGLVPELWPALVQLHSKGPSVHLLMLPCRKMTDMTCKREVFLSLSQLVISILPLTSHLTFKCNKWAFCPPPHHHWLKELINLNS